MNTKAKKPIRIKLVLAIVLLLVILVPAAWVLAVRLEGERPVVKLTPETSVVGASTDLVLDLADERCGLRGVRVTMTQKGKEVALAEASFPAVGLLKGGIVNSKRLEIKLQPEAQGLADGEALLRIAVTDHSWRNWWHGNRTLIEKTVTIDTRPPSIAVVSRAHYISQGGSGLVVYRLSERCPSSGVQVGEHFFPGYPGFLAEDESLHLAFFAVAYDQDPDVRIFLRATDEAGNDAKAGFPHLVNPRRFPNDIIQISDRFLDWKMPEFEADIGAMPGTSRLEQFLTVNRELRQSNYQTVKQICSQTDAVVHWEGVFSRLPRSAPKASFAEQRDYRYAGEIVDHQVHLGADLASVAQSPVPAANSGRVVFGENLGIYGKTVIIDHGFGLFSMYSHLSLIEVEKGQMVAKNDIIGRTGMTGLAGGDHLHFSMIVHDTFVNPVEWWDPVWIRNNITSKLEDAKPVATETSG